MAQLWAEIRTSSPDDRRAFARVLAERLAPSISEHFETVTGLEGPEFVKLVRSLIQLDQEDIQKLASDLRRIQADPQVLGQTLSTATARALASQVAAEEGREDLIDDIFELMVDRVEDVVVADAPLLASNEPSLETNLPIGGSESVAMPQDRKTAYELAQERVAGYDERGGEVDGGRVDLEPLTERGDVSVVAAPSPTGPASSTARTRPNRRLRQREPAAEGSWTTPLRSIDRMPDGWRRRRAISALVRDGEVSVSEALELAKLLGRHADRLWILGDLIETDLTLADRTLLAGTDMPKRLRRRLESSGG